MLPPFHIPDITGPGGFLDFVQSRSMGCGSVAGLLLEAGGVGGKQVEDDEVEGGGATECVGAVAGFLGVIA